jgi:purine-binding chemotaxis protein CheW
MEEGVKNSEDVVSSKEIQLVVFKLGTEEYGVDVHEVKSIIKKSEITRIPNAPEFVEGIMNLRGKIVVIINLLKRFGTFNEAEHKGTHIIISEVEGNSFGIVVDDVQEVIKITNKEMRKAPGIISAKIHVEYLNGIGILDEGKRLLILLNLQKILSEKEMLEMAEVTQEIKAKARFKGKNLDRDTYEIRIEKYHNKLNEIEHTLPVLKKEFNALGKKKTKKHQTKKKVKKKAKKKKHSFKKRK